MLREWQPGKDWRVCVHDIGVGLLLVTKQLS